MADKSFGVKELNLLNASGTPTITSPNNLNLNANTVAISTSVTVGQNITISANAGIASLNVTGIATITRPSTDNSIQRYVITNNSDSDYRFTGPGQDGSDGIVRRTRFCSQTSLMLTSLPVSFKFKPDQLYLVHQ